MLRDQQTHTAYFIFYVFFLLLQNTDLAVAASLNGGNVLASFVTMIEDWTRTLGLDISEVYP